MNANFGLVDDLPARVKDKRVKREQIAERALRDMARVARSTMLQREPAPHV